MFDLFKLMVSYYY